MDRRSIIAGILGAGIDISLPLSVLANYDCYSGACDAWIPSDAFPHIYQEPHTLWCWAATLAMICQWYGHPISMRSIVRQTFGGEINAPADPITLIQAVNGTFEDEGGERVHLAARVWSVLHGLNMLDNARIVEELREGHPLVVCNASHMMALIGVSHLPGSSQIFRAWVADPAVNGVVTNGIGLPRLASGCRYLYDYEITQAGWGGQLTFVAAIDVA